MLVLTENNCAIHRVAERHPAVCAMELTLFRRVLGPDVEVTRVSHAMAGDAGCTYCIRPRTDDPAGSDWPGRRLAPPAAGGELLAPAAEATDQAAVVPRSHLEALAGAGLMGLYRPPAAPPAVVREVYETLAGACGVTFFVWVQHHAPVRMLAASANGGAATATLDELCAGGLLGGVAFAYLRRPGPAGGGRHAGCAGGLPASTARRRG